MPDLLKDKQCIQQITRPRMGKKKASERATPSLSIVYNYVSAFNTNKPDPTYCTVIYLLGVVVFRHAQDIVWKFTCSDIWIMTTWSPCGDIWIMTTRPSDGDTRIMQWKNTWHRIIMHGISKCRSVISWWRLSPAKFNCATVNGLYKKICWGTRWLIYQYYNINNISIITTYISIKYQHHFKSLLHVLQ